MTKSKIGFSLIESTRTSASSKFWMMPFLNVSGVQMKRATSSLGADIRAIEMAICSVIKL